jgi:putative transposase
MRKRYTASYKAKVALEALKGERSMAELSSRYEIHASLIREWRKMLQTGMSEIFSNGRRGQNEEAERARLYEEIGRLKVELDWVKRKYGMLGR